MPAGLLPKLLRTTDFGEKKNVFNALLKKRLKTRSEKFELSSLDISIFILFGDVLKPIHVVNVRITINSVKLVLIS